MRKRSAASRAGAWLASFAMIALMLTPADASEPAAEPVRPPLSTPWTDQVGPDHALPEYPRPQLTRDRWQNLNGPWQYTSRPPRNQVAPTRADYGDQILVPYPPESALSGIQRHDDQMWYRRTFETPPDWAGQRMLLHFGAVDQQAMVWVNGQQVATHEGGYTEFSADVTDALRADGEQEVVVKAEDRNDVGTYPLGKQRRDPGGILYTGSSGIWQTVWMEPVPAAHVTKLDITADLSGCTVTPRVSGVRGQRAEVVVAKPGGAEVARTTGPAGAPLRIEVPQPRLWSSEDPYLYEVTVRLLDEQGQPGDEVHSYTGLRTVGVRNDAKGRPRIAVNGKITFLHGPLDQGFWPDGLHTAPTDEALRFDLDKTKELGFNFVRKHVKVEPARWYYWADKLGLLVWQDMPSLPVLLDNPQGPQAPPVPDAQAHFETELMEMVDQLRSVTSIVGWVPFNEGWGEYDTARIAGEVAAADPSRLVNADSGVNCCHSHPDSRAGDVYDDHTYVGPGRPDVREDRVTVDGEYGGLGLALDGHLWPGEPEAYEMTDSTEQLTERYLEVSDELRNVVRDKGLSGAIYTQTSDVENEVNGFYTYDRRVLKPSLDAVAQANRAVIEAGSQ